MRSNLSELVNQHLPKSNLQAISSSFNPVAPITKGWIFRPFAYTQQIDSLFLHFIFKRQFVAHDMRTVTIGFII